MVKMHCPKCKNELFELYASVYAEKIIVKAHYEIVCSRCGNGNVILKEDIS